MMVVATTSIGSVIIVEASLSFLGVTPGGVVISWGGLLASRMMRHFAEAPWMVLFPGFALTFLVFGVNILGDALRDVLDPRMRGR
jgi:peptide/nickel transport system permease protein